MKSTKRLQKIDRAELALPKERALAVGSPKPGEALLSVARRREDVEKALAETRAAIHGGLNQMVDEQVEKFIHQQTGKPEPVGPGVVTMRVNGIVASGRSTTRAPLQGVLVALKVNKEKVAEAVTSPSGLVTLPMPAGEGRVQEYEIEVLGADCKPIHCEVGKLWDKTPPVHLIELRASAALGGLSDRAEAWVGELQTMRKRVEQGKKEAAEALRRQKEELERELNELDMELRGLQPAPAGAPKPPKTVIEPKPEEKETPDAHDTKGKERA